MPCRAVKNLDDFSAWPLKFRRWTLAVAEGDGHVLWLACDDLRRLWPDLPSDAQLKARGRQPLLLVQSTRRLYLSEPALREWAERDGHPSVELLQFMEWFERQVASVARRKRELAGLAPLRPEDWAPPTAPSVPSDPTQPGQPSMRRKAWRLLAGGVASWFAPTWRGERGPLLTLGLCAATPLLFDLLARSLLALHPDPTRRFQLLLWISVLIIAAAALLSVWMVVGMSRSLWRARSGPATLLWAAPLWLITVALAPLGSLGAFEQDLLSEWWDSVAGRYRPARIDADPDLGRIVVSGAFKFGSAEALEAALQRHPTLTLVELRSPGGYVLEGLRMARVVMDRGLDTAALESCASACTLVLAAGRERYLGPQAEVGFHRSGSRYQPVSLGWTRTDHQIADYYATRGASPAFIDQALALPITEIWWAPHDEMYTQGFATRPWAERRAGY